MVDQNQNKKEEIKLPEKLESSPEQSKRFLREAESALEKAPEKESSYEKIVSDGLRREIELMDVDDNLKKQAEQKANQIHALADDDKLKKLLVIAKEKGLVFAIKVAKSMNDPFILDTLHDALAKEGFYKDFVE